MFNINRVSSFPAFFSRTNPEKNLPWVVMILGFNRYQGSYHKCIGSLFGDNSWVIADSTCLKGPMRKQNTFFISRTLLFVYFLKSEKG